MGPGDRIQEDALACGAQKAGSTFLAGSDLAPQLEVQPVWPHRNAGEEWARKWAQGHQDEEQLRSQVRLLAVH